MEMSSHIAVLESENPRAMHPSSCFAARLTRPAKDPVPYSREALKQDLFRVRTSWKYCQANRDRNAIYGYLSAVFDLVMWWRAEDRAISRARWALQLQGVDLPTADEPFAMVIFCTADRAKVDKRTRSKWARNRTDAITVSNVLRQPDRCAEGSYAPRPDPGPRHEATTTRHAKSLCPRRHCPDRLRFDVPTS